MAAFQDGRYPNVLLDFGYAPHQIDKRLADVWSEMFEGTDRIYFEYGEDMGYMEDTGNHDARTEGMSYGMMMAVQMDRKDIFDRLWRWSFQYMRHEEGKYKDYFAWHCRVEDGGRIHDGPAPDGEEYYAMALFFASKRWGDGEEPLDYGNQARRILRAMVHKGETEEGDAMMDPEAKMVRFIPEARFSDPSYHLPHFYELFALWADEGDRSFWKEAARVSRDYFRKSCHPVTGLAPNLANYDGMPFIRQTDPPERGLLSGCHYSDAYRVVLNIALDQAWFGVDGWQAGECQRIQTFIQSQPDGYEKVFYIDGTVFPEPAMHPLGMMSTLASAALAAGDTPEARKAVELFFTSPLRKGVRRYYDNCLYLFSLLALSGNYRIWK